MLVCTLVKIKNMKSNAFETDSGRKITFTFIPVWCWPCFIIIEDIDTVFTVCISSVTKMVAKPGPGRDFRNWKPGFCWFLRKYSFVLHEICRITLLHLFLSSLKFLSSQNEFFNIYYRLSLSKWLKWVVNPGYIFLGFIWKLLCLI